MKGEIGAPGDGISRRQFLAATGTTGVAAVAGATGLLAAAGAAGFRLHLRTTSQYDSDPDADAL